jgi:hypothetical protein
MKKALAVLAIATLLLSNAACTFDSVLSEIRSTITKFAPLLPLIEMAACIVPANPVCLAVEAFGTKAEPLAADVGAAFTAWSQASAAAQPGKLPQLITAVETWQTALKNGLTIPGISPSALALIEADLNSATDLLTALEAAEKGGGTTAALAQVINEATPMDDGPLYAFINPLNALRKPRTLKLKNGAVIHTWAWHKGILLQKLGVPTGDAAKDSANKQISAAIKKLG